MAQQIINTGAVANDGTGESLRDAFNAVNDNFSNIWAQGPVDSQVVISNNLVTTNQTNLDLVLAANGIGNVTVNSTLTPGIDSVYDLGASDAQFDTVWARYYQAGSGTFSGDVTVDGNLVVAGNIIQVGNIVTDSLTIQLGNTVTNAAGANGAGITVGANDNIATILYSSTSNTWAMNIGANITGNVTAPYFIGNGALLTGIVTSNYANANAVAYGQAGWAGNIIPSGNAVYSLGNATNQWNDLYVSNTTIYMNNVPISLTAGNVLTVNGNAVLQNDSNTSISTTGNISAANIAVTSGSLSWPNASIVQTSASDFSITGDGQVTVRSLDGTYQWTFDSSGNLTAPGNIGTSANVSANYFLGNGSQLTGLSTSRISNGNSNVNIPTANGNVTVTTNGTYTWSFEDTGQLTFPASPTSIYGGMDNDFTINTANANAATYTFTFSQFGDLTVPVNLNVIENLYAADIVGPGNGNVTITANTQSWLFDTNGVITLPSTGQIRSVGNTGMRLSAGASDTTGLLLDNTGDAEIYANANVTVYTDAGNIGWTFDNTGNLTVPNIIQGSADSDYALKLGAFPEETAAGRWLQVRSGDVADHIHFDTSNNSAWNFYVGSDNQYVLIGNTGNVSIGSYDSSNNATYQWTFDKTGNVNLPNNGSINFNAGGITQATDEDFVITVNDADDDGFAIFNRVTDTDGNVVGQTELRRDRLNINLDMLGSNYQWQFSDNQGIMYLPGNIFGNYGSDTSFFVTDNGSGGTMEMKTISYIGDTLGSNVRVTQSNATISTSNAAYTWTFDNTGNLTVPGNTIVSTANATGGLGGKNISITAGASDTVTWNSNPGGNVNIAGGYGSFGDGGGGPGGQVNIIGGSSSDSHAGNVTINSGNSTWTFDYTGNLTAPGNISTDWLNISNVGNITSLEADVKLQIVADAGNTAPYWTFNNDGNLFVPGNINGDNSAPLYIDGAGSHEGYISLPSAAFGNEQVVIVNNFSLGNGIRLETNGGNLFFDNAGVLTVPGNIVMPPGTSLTGTGASPAPNISGFTSVSAETLSATGNVVGGNIRTAGLITATGNITTAGNFVGNGAALTNVTVSVAGNIVGTQSNVTLVAGSYSYTFDNTGILTLPAGGGNEGAEINFTKAANSTLSGNSVAIDQYVDRIRFFEGGGNTRGAYIDLTQAADGVGTLLNNRVSGLVNAGTFVTMDLLKATVTTSGNRGLSLAATTGSFNINISGTYGGVGGASGSAGTGTINTTPSSSQFGWNFTSQAEGSTYIITDTTNNRAYRVTLQIGGSFNNNLISIERLI